MERKVVERRLREGWILGLIVFAASVVEAIFPPTPQRAQFWIHGNLSFWGYVIKAGLVLFGTVLVLIAWRRIKAGKSGYNYGLAGGILLLLNVGEVFFIEIDGGYAQTFNVTGIICFIGGILSIMGAVESRQAKRTRKEE